VLVPHYDEDTGVLFLWGRVRASATGWVLVRVRVLIIGAGTPWVDVTCQGDGSISFYEFTHDPPAIHYLTRFESSTLQIGVAFRPKTVLNVKAVRSQPR